MDEKDTAKPPSLSERRRALLQEDKQLSTAEERLAAELARIEGERRRIKGKLTQLDGRPHALLWGFEGTNLSPEARLWLADHGGIRQARELQHQNFTPGAFLTVLKKPRTDDLGVFDEISRYCQRVNPTKWTQDEVKRVWEELQKRSGSVATPPEGTPL